MERPTRGRGRRGQPHTAEGERRDLARTARTSGAGHSSGREPRATPLAKPTRPTPEKPSLPDHCASRGRAMESPDPPKQLGPWTETTGRALTGAAPGGTASANRGTEQRRGRHRATASLGPATQRRRARQDPHLSWGLRQTNKGSAATNNEGGGGPDADPNAPPEALLTGHDSFPDGGALNWEFLGGGKETIDADPPRTRPRGHPWTQRAPGRNAARLSEKRASLASQQQRESAWGCPSATCEGG